MTYKLSFLSTEPKKYCHTTIESGVLNGADYNEQHMFETEQIDSCVKLCVNHPQCTSATFRLMPSSNKYVCLLHGKGDMMKWRTEDQNDRLIRKMCSAGKLT